MLPCCILRAAVRCQGATPYRLDVTVRALRRNAKRTWWTSTNQTVAICVSDGKRGSPACAGCCSAPSALIRTYQTSHGRRIVTIGMPYPDAPRCGPRDVATREVRQPGRATHELLHPSSARNRRTRARPHETVLASQRTRCRRRPSSLARPSSHRRPRPMLPTVARCPLPPAEHARTRASHWKVSHRSRVPTSQSRALAKSPTQGAVSA